MSEFWNAYRTRVEEGANRLPAPPKEVDQSVLWMKAYITEKLGETKYKNAKNSMYVGTGETFGFKEELVNYIIHYAFEAGVKSREDVHKRSTEDMRNALDKIKDALDDIGFIEYPDCY
jgi:hypothetical protein